MHKPLVSILITAYNCQEYLAQTLESLLSQTYENIEVIVVEDGSDDATAQILKEKASADSRVKAYFPGRIGRSKALNLGLSHCNGKYVAVNDADDFSKPERIEKQVQYLEEHPEVGLLGSAKEISEGDKKWITDVPQTDSEIRRFFVKGQPIQHSTVMFRKDVLDLVNGYNENIPFLLDRDIFLRVAMKTKMHQLAEPLITLNRSANQYFLNKYKGRERNRLSTKYQLKAVSDFGFSPLLKLEIWAKFLYSTILEFKNRPH